MSWKAFFEVNFQVYSLVAVVALLLAPLIPERGFIPFAGFVWCAVLCKVISLALTKDGSR